MDPKFIPRETLFFDDQLVRTVADSEPESECEDEEIEHALYSTLSHASDYDTVARESCTE